jgi:DNA-binding protein
MANGLNGKSRVYFYIITVLVGLTLGAYGFILNAGAAEIANKVDRDVYVSEKEAIIAKINAQDELINTKLEHTNEKLAEIKQMIKDLDK